MNQKVKLVVVLVALIAVVAGAGLVYRFLLGQESIGDSAATLTNDTAEQPSQEQQDGQSKRQEAPDITFLDSEGNTVRLSDLRGEPVIINFWASWCPPCKEEMPTFDQAYQEYGTQIQFVMLNVTDGQRETITTATQYVSEGGFTFPIFFDANLEGVYAYYINAIPQTIFIDRDGNIATRQIGMLSEAGLQSGIALIL